VPSDPGSDRRFGDLVSVIEATRSLANASDLSEGMSLFAREVTLLFQASGCLVSSYDPDAETVTDRAAHVVPPARLNVVAESYALADYPATARVLHELTEISTSIRDGCDHAGIVLGAARMTELLEEQHVATVGALAAALEAKDAYTGNHAHTIAELALAVGERLGMSARELRAVRLGALLHDVGKIGIPESILNKPGRLSAEEFAVMKQHTVIGADIISGIPGMGEVMSLVRWSHERWDGNGYPDGLRGAEIPRGACVIAVCDAYHAMIEDRVYRRAMSQDVALAELRRCTGTQFMPAAVEALEQVLDLGRRRLVRFTEAA
jgi:putative nucleotidyltransferase with HDIG domain